MSCNNSLLQRLAAAKFYVWDLHLYLDTHPCDTKAAELLEKYLEKVESLTKEYETQYGALTVSNAHGQDWYKDPWSWQNGGVC